MQAAGLAVEVAQAGREAGDVAGLLEGEGGGVDGGLQRVLEGDHPAVCVAVCGELVELVFGGGDLLGAFEVGLGREGGVHDRLADVDELAAYPGIVDGLAVVAGVDDADHGGEQGAEVGGAADLVEDAGVLELGAQGDRVGELGRLDAPGNGGEDAGVDGVGEMVGREELGDPVIRLVVGEQCPEQRLFCGDVRGGEALGNSQQGRVDVCHRRMIAQPIGLRQRWGLWTSV